MQVSAVANSLAKSDSNGIIEVQSSASSVSEKQNEKLTEAKNAVEVLKQAGASKSDSQKNAARQKLELLRQQLQKMQLLGATPKQIAQMAKELARAVKDYTAAGGTSSEVHSVPADAGTGASGDVAAMSGRDDTAKDVTEVTLPPKAETESTAPSEIPSTSKVTGLEADKIKSEDARRTLAQYEKTLVSQAESSHSAKASGGDDGDRIFYSAARLLAKQLGAAAQQAAKRAPSAKNLVDAIKAIDSANSTVDRAEALFHTGGLSFSA